MLQWLLASALVPELASWDRRSLSRCDRDTWDLEERRRVGDLGIRQGWGVAIPILREVDIYCIENDIDHAIEGKWRRDVFAVMAHRPKICDELSRAVLRQ